MCPNNKKIINTVKNDILFYIKSKSIISVDQIKKSNFDFLTNFYVEFFLEELHKMEKLDKINISNDQVVYKIKPKD